MIIRAVLFYAAATATVVYAVRRGGQPERVTSAMLIIAAIGTTLLPGMSFREVVWPLFAIDLALLIGLVALSVLADRYWPMYFAAIHLITVALHGVRAYDRTIIPTVYARLGGELAYPTLAVLAIGTWRHCQRGRERDWSWQPRRPREPS